MVKTLYDILEVSPTASSEVIKNAYRALAAKYHPDAGEYSNENAFKILGKAFSVLSDPEKRRQYDARLLHGEESVFLGLDDDEASRRIETVKRLDGSDTWCTIDEHIRRKGAELSKANLCGLRLRSLKLEGALFDGSDLSGADIIDVSMKGASFVGCSCQHSKFDKVDFTNAGFDQSVFTKCIFVNCVFDYTRISDATFTSCDFTGSTFGSSQLTRINFNDSVLQGVLFASNYPSYCTSESAPIAQCSFARCNLNGAVFGNINSREGNSGLKHVYARNFTKTSFEQANMTSINAEGCRFDGCNFDEACLAKANLKKSAVCTVQGFRNVSLLGCDLSESTLKNLNLQTCNVINTRFHDATVINVTFPGGFSPPPKSSAQKEASQNVYFLGVVLMFLFGFLIVLAAALSH